ncbi:hypothetical protein OAO87_04420 [bacterium]|nr:hypothetical protein [bacterium]
MPTPAPAPPIDAPPAFDELEHLRKKAATAAEAKRKRRQKAARKARDETQRDQVSKYVSLPYGLGDAPAVEVDCPMWSTRMDLKAAYTRALGEVMDRCATVARQRSSCTKSVAARFGGMSFQVVVLDGSAATRMTSEELSLDLLTILASLGPHRSATRVAPEAVVQGGALDGEGSSSMDALPRLSGPSVDGDDVLGLALAGSTSRVM